MTFTPTRREDYLLSGFVQDDLTVVPDRLHFIAGTKLEQNSYSGFEVEPSARVLYTPNEQNTLWGAISRAVRTPSTWEQDSKLIFATIPTAQGIPAQIDTFGNSNFNSEDLLALETGYRVKPTQTLSVDATVFYNYYNNLRGGINGRRPSRRSPRHMCWCRSRSTTESLGKHSYRNRGQLEGHTDLAIERILFIPRCSTPPHDGNQQHDGDDFRGHQPPKPGADSLVPGYHEKSRV